MKKILRALAAAAALSLSTAAALGQSSPGMKFGDVPTAGQWNGFFAAKQDALGYRPVNQAGDTMQGPLGTFPSAAAKAGLNVPHGAAPTSPVNGDLWTTSSGLFARINGVTIGPFASTTTVAPFTVTGNGVGVTSADGLVVQNTTPATAILQQWSPRIRLTGSGWKTNATAGAQQVDYIIEVQPTVGTANPNSTLTISGQNNLGGFGVLASLSNLSIFNVAPGGGYQIATAGPTGHVLRGNGTAYVDGVLACADLSVACLTAASSPTLTGNWTHNPTSGDAITVNTAALSSAKAWSSTQSTPVGGPIAGPYSLNLWTITYSTQITGSGSDPAGNSNAGGVGFRVNMNITTAGVAGTSKPIITGLFTATVSTTTAITDVTGLAGTAFTNVAMAGGGYLEGMNAVASVGPSGSAAHLVGLDVGAFILSGGSAINRFGVSVLTAGATRGTTRDAAIVFNSNTATTFKNAFLFSNFSSTAPLGSDTVIFAADTAYSISDFASLGNMDISGNVLLFSKVGLSGDGRMILGGNSNTLPTFPVVLQAKRVSGGSATISSDTNTTTGASAFDILNSTSTVEAFLVVNEAARTAVRFGQVVGNWSQVGSLGGNGLMVGTFDATPLLIGTNNATRMQITSAGLTNIGTFVAPATNSFLTINKNAASPLATALVALVHAAGADSTQPAILLDSYAGTNAGNQAFFTIRKCRGTAAACVPVQGGDALGYFGMVGSNANGAFASEAGSNGGVFFGAVATQTWSLTQAGSELRLYTTPNGTVTIQQVVTIQQSGGMSIGTTTDPGIGALLLNTNLWHPTIANGSVATVLGSVGPVGSRTTVQEWFPIKSASGAIRYVPGF